MSLLFIVSFILFVNSLFVIFRKGFFGRFYFEINGINGVVIAILSALVSGIISYGYIKDTLITGQDLQFMLIIIVVIFCISWLLNFRLLR